MWNDFLHSNDTKWRLARTIVQEILAVVITNLDAIIGTFTIPPEMKQALICLCIAILSPIMSELGKLNGEEPKIDVKIEK